MRKLCSAAKAARKPLPPAELIEAKHDRVHREPGRARPARTVRTKRRGPLDEAGLERVDEGMDLNRTEGTPVIDADVP